MEGGSGEGCSTAVRKRHAPRVNTQEPRGEFHAPRVKRQVPRALRQVAHGTKQNKSKKHGSRFEGELNLQIAVDDPVVVDVGDSIKDLPHNRLDLSLRETLQKFPRRKEREREERKKNPTRQHPPRELQHA
eukprot:2876147-Rhodomonas_salina.1